MSALERSLAGYLDMTSTPSSILKTGDDMRSPLARLVGSRSYHAEVFTDGPFPVEEPVARQRPRLRYKHDSAFIVGLRVQASSTVANGTGSMSIANRTLDSAANIVLSDCKMAPEERLPRPLPNSSTPELRSSWAGSVMVLPLIEPIWTNRMRGSPSGDAWPPRRLRSLLLKIPTGSREQPARQTRAMPTGNSAPNPLAAGSVRWSRPHPELPLPPALFDPGRSR